mmetsp:Transcript_38998/g.76664  ORF Transcript_38998/g.76664 Transcript_38998/m.76664 type:complete len:118 (+) Transcript_38998:1539-1892(+)
MRHEGTGRQLNPPVRPSIHKSIKHLIKKSKLVFGSSSKREACLLAGRFFFLSLIFFLSFRHQSTCVCMSVGLPLSHSSFRFAWTRTTHRQAKKNKQERRPKRDGQKNGDGEERRTHV